MITLLFAGCVAQKQSNYSSKKSYKKAKKIEKIKANSFNSKSKLFSTNLDSQKQEGLFKISETKIKFKKSKIDKSKRSIRNLDMSN